MPLTLSEVGAIVGPVGSEAWRYVTAPFVYDDLGALLVIGLAIWVFGSAIERRLGSLATATLILATGHARIARRRAPSTRPGSPTRSSSPAATRSRSDCSPPG